MVETKLIKTAEMLSTAACQQHHVNSIMSTASTAIRRRQRDVRGWTCAKCEVACVRSMCTQTQMCTTGFMVDNVPCTCQRVDSEKLPFIPQYAIAETGISRAMKQRGVSRDMSPQSTQITRVKICRLQQLIHCTKSQSACIFLHAHQPFDSNW